MTQPKYTANEQLFLGAARKMQDHEGSFCFVDLQFHGYHASFETARSTLGSLVKKGACTEPDNGWSVLLDDKPETRP